jgi:hypothetical protein
MSCPDPLHDYADWIEEDEDMKAAREEIENMSFEEYLSLPVYKG